MSLQPCQMDAYAAVGVSRVVSCTALDDDRYDVVVDQSVLFPEGGGQPADRGMVADAIVLDVQKDAQGAVHVTTDRAVAEGAVQVQVDMTRRFDHMQQHTAQHLVTAIAQDRMGRGTVSFHLGSTASTIDLDGSLTGSDLRKLEEMVNAEVRHNRTVRHRVVNRSEYETLEVRSRGLPAGHTGSIRLVEIDGLDLNTCGGTHVAQLGELQMVHLVGTEKVRGGVRVAFVAGGRALDRMRASTRRADALNRALKCGPEGHLEQVQRLLDEAKASGRARRTLLSRFAEALGQGVPSAGADRAVHLHQAEADLGFLRGIADAARAAGHTGPLLLTGGEESGVFLLDADPERIKAVGPKVAEALGGRGGGRGSRFQGKGTTLAAASALLLQN